jgi:tetratricopeptide (TPR) repeat protein
VHPDSADCLWHAGYARVLEAEERRRAEQPDLALESYAKADAWFVKSAAAKPEYADSTTQYRALCALGRGFAHLLAGRRNEAARALADALAIRPAVATARDGLDREAVDLLDGALEWRVEGASPVDVHDLAERLERADPGNAFWLRSISDSELREALRADGRGEVVEGDRYLRVSIDVARRALAVSDDPDSRRALAQPLTILAERLLERGDPEQARPLLAEAAPLQDEPPPEPAADLAALAAKLREKLGAARPRFRPGR